MTLLDMMQDLAKRGCYPCVSYRGRGIYRAHINAMGNRWCEGKTPDSAMRKAFESWRRDGYPMDGLACVGRPATLKVKELVLAKQFHDTYERLAPSFGYETRPETREFNPESPNGRLMVAVCKEIIEQNIAICVKPAPGVTAEAGE